MRIIKADKIKDAVKKCFLIACISPGKDIIDALEKAEKEETDETAKAILKQILKNDKIAAETQMPCCQDTGMAVVFLDIGYDVHIEGDVTEAVNSGVREAYCEGYFRKSVLTAIERKNTGDNTPAILHTALVPGDKIKITCAPKGFGSENMSALKMLKPADGINGIKDFVLETVKNAGGAPCPPVVIGIGIGGTFEYAALMAKRQLLRPIDSKNSDETLREMEDELKRSINELDIGPMGMGGKTYCLKVNICQHPTHLAGLPVAVNINCHASRHEEVVL
jgi:fumarate hydratase subunit alpha